MRITNYELRITNDGLQPSVLTRFRLFVILLFILHTSYLILPARAAGQAVRTSTANGTWSSPATWSGGTVPMDGDSVWIVAGDSVTLDTSTARLNLLVIQGKLFASTDTIFLASDFNSGDTLVSVFGTLDAGSGWIAVADSATARPIVHIAGGGLFRTKASLPYDNVSIFDSLLAPLFACDSTSTFEYYSDNLDLIDVSYLANNLIGHAYGNLALNNMVASFRANPVTIQGTLHIELGASVIPSARKGQTVGYDTQNITVLGDVVNDNQGESGSPGAGLHGCGMQSFSTDVWSFGQTGAARDTCHWSGPSQVGSVIVKPNTMLAVRFYSDNSCDSLDILGTLNEEGGVCGGHLIGRAFSEFPAILDASHPVDSFENLGLTIRSGTNPYLGRTRVVRTSGYPPPGSNSADRPVLRYYSVTPGAGPQQGMPNEMTFRFHCDELNGAVPFMLHFWRSRDRGSTWAFSGMTSFDPATYSYVWDTTTVGFPNDSGSFYWMLSEGYTDVPLPVDLSSFNIQSEGNTMLLEWQTASEINAVGFELERAIKKSPATLIAGYQSDPALLSRSKYGADYSYSDEFSGTGEVRYDLYEVSQDAIRTLVGSRTATIESESILPVLSGLSYHSGVLQLTLSLPDASSATISIVDAIGRQILSQQVDLNASGNGAFAIPVSLVPGVYFIEVNWNNARTLQKLLVLI